MANGGSVAKQDSVPMWWLLGDIVGRRYGIVVNRVALGDGVEGKLIIDGGSVAKVDKAGDNTGYDIVSSIVLSVLVLTIRDKYAKHSKENAAADKTINSLNQQYQDAMDEICLVHSRVHDLEVENEEVWSMMEMQMVEFEKSASKIASIESLKRDADRALMQNKAQTITMREALVGETSHMTAQLSIYFKELGELQEEKDSPRMVEMPRKKKLPSFEYSSETESGKKRDG